ATLEPGPAVLHMEFTARGDQLWLSVRDGGEIQVWDPYTLKLLKRLPAESPSGISFSSRAHETGLCHAPGPPQPPTDRSLSGRHVDVLRIYHSPGTRDGLQ